MAADFFSDLFKDVIMRDWLRENLTGIFDSVNIKILEVSGELSLSPSQWNPAIWNFIKQINDVAIVPIALVVLTFCIGMEIYRLAVDKNSQHDIDLSDLIILLVKLFVAMTLIKNMFPLLLSIFDIVGFAIAKMTGIISLDLTTNIVDIDTIIDQMETVYIGEYFAIWLLSVLADLIMWGFNIAITLIIYGRMLTIYLYCSIAAIPTAAIFSKELDISKNFFKSLCALATQGFLMMFCLAMYAVLIKNFIYSSNIKIAITQAIIYAALLIFSLFKTSSIAKSIFNAH